MILQWGTLISSSLVYSLVYTDDKKLYDIYVTVNVIKLVIMHIPRLLRIISSPIGKSDEKWKFHKIFGYFA